MDRQWQRASRIVVFRLDNIGDVIMTGPALRAIRENLPHVRLTLMASPAGAQAAPLLPWVDEVLARKVLWQALEPPPFDATPEWELIEDLRRRRFDAAVILTSFRQSPWPAALAALLAGIPLRLGASHECDLDGLMHNAGSPPDEIHQVERNLLLLESAGFAVNDRSLSLCIAPAAGRRAREHLHQRGLSLGAPYLLLAPCASAPARTVRWERLADATRLLMTATGWRVVVTGSARDRPRIGPLLQALGRQAIDVVGATSIPELAALIRHARLVLCNNTAALHLAEATRTPSVVLYSGTDLESQWAPRDGPARVLRRHTGCAPCYAIRCPYDRECLAIEPQQIVNAALELLARPPSSRGRPADPSPVTENPAARR